jgi:hypothetical protein
METLWAIYLTVCISTTCVNQEIQRFDTAELCKTTLPAYLEIPNDSANWDTVEWQCLPLGGSAT